MKTTAISYDTAITGANIAKICRKTKHAVVVGRYTWNTLVLTLWGWSEGKAGTENKHEMPPPHDEILLFGDAIMIASENDMTTDFTNDQYLEFYNDAFKGFEDLGDSDSEDIDGDSAEMEVDEAEDAEEAEEVEEAEEAEEVEEAEEAEEDAEAEEEEAEEAEDAEAEAEVEEAEDEDGDCYEDGEEGGGGKRRAPRRRTAQTPDNRRIDMGLRSRIKIPSPVGKRAPRWQTAPELESEDY